MVKMRLNPFLVGLIGFCLLIMNPLTTRAQSLETPKGWTRQVDGVNLVWQGYSPANNTNILIVFDKAAPSAQALKPWFESQITELSQQGKITNRSGIKSEGTLIKDAFMIKIGADNLRTFAFGYDTKNGKQIILVMMTGEVNVADPVVQSAFDQVASLWRQGAALDGSHRLNATIATPKSKPAPVQTAQSKPNPTKPKSGQCREELRTITTMQLQQVCYAPIGGMSNCQLQSVPVQMQVLQEQCY